MQTEFDSEDDAFIDAVAARVIQKLDERSRVKPAKSAQSHEVFSGLFAAIADAASQANDGKGISRPGFGHFGAELF